VAQAFVISHFAMNNFKFIYKPPMPSAEVVVNHRDKAMFAKAQGDVRSYVSGSTYQENSQEKLTCAIVPTSLLFLEKPGLPRFLRQTQVEILLGLASICQGDTGRSCSLLRNNDRARRAAGFEAKVCLRSHGIGISVATLRFILARQ
jgi:hypothetical protein